jgi:hypothetical protein
MGTRADFYVGRGASAEWIGSVAWDGYPSGFDFLGAKTEPDWRAAVAGELAGREDATTPENGWPWPWDDSGTTDYAYAFDGGKVWASDFGGDWFDPLGPEPKDSGSRTKVAFPNMKDRKAAAAPGSRRSGVMVVSMKRAGAR